MSYRITRIFKLGPTNAALTLKVQLVGIDGVNVGSAITTGFVELANGEYLFDTSAIPAAHHGAGKVLKADGTYLTSFGIDPTVDGENLDEKVSTISGGGTGGVTISPLLASVAQPLDSDKNVTVYEASAPTITWTIIDAANNPVDLSGKSVRFVTYLAVVPTPLTPVIQKNSLPISGASNNVVTCTLDTIDTAQAGRSWRYLLWNVTDNVVLAAGFFHILPSVKGS